MVRNSSDKTKSPSGFKQKKLVSPAALSLLFSATFANHAAAMTPIVDNYVAVENVQSLGVTTQENNNGNQQQNQNGGVGAPKPRALRHLNATLDQG